jgi:N-glycosylase/DNA lyase
LFKEHIINEANFVKEIYNEIKPDIKTRLNEFKDIYKNGDNKDIFLELSFCLLTPQSKAKTCWKAALELKEKNLLFSDNAKKISTVINSVRFKNKKSEFIILARKMFFNNGNLPLKEKIESFSDNFERRLWFANNIKGMGLKEASHFLRNIGFGKNLSILDRHILKNLALLKVIPEVPSSITPRIYFEIEKKMTAFSEKIGIDMEALDFILWYKEAKEVFK